MGWGGWAAGERPDASPALGGLERLDPPLRRSKAAGWVGMARVGMEVVDW